MMRFLIGKNVKRLRASFAVGHFNVRWRIKLLNALVQWLLPMYSRIQPRLVRSIIGALINKASFPHLMEYHQEYPASTETFLLPREYPPAFHREYAFQAVYTYLMRDVWVGVQSGFCFTDDGQLFGESALSNAWEGLQRTPLDVMARRNVGDLQISGCMTVVHTNIYYHFMLDEMARFLRVLKRYPDTQPVFYEKAPAYMREVLDFLLNENVMRKAALPCREGVVHAGSYAFSAAYHDRFIRKEDIDLLRKTVLPRIQKKTGQKPVYVSRRYSPRALDNEQEVEDLMRELGFGIVYLEQVPWVKQVEMFRSADFIAASHGGGLANLVWCEPGTRVVEIIQQNHFNDCFTHLACQLHLSYDFVWSVEGTGKWGTVDIEALRQKIVMTKESSGDFSRTEIGNG